jgi:hypothetical protein
VRIESRGAVVEFVVARIDDEAAVEMVDWRLGRVSRVRLDAQPEIMSA